MRIDTVLFGRRTNKTVRMKKSQRSQDTMYDNAADAYKDGLHAVTRRSQSQKRLILLRGKIRVNPILDNREIFMRDIKRIMNEINITALRPRP